MRIILTLLITWLSAIETIRADYQATTLATGLNYPWSMVQVAPSSGLIATRAGDLLLMDLNTGKTTPVSGGPATYVASQGGYFDLSLHPQFTENKRVYLALADGTPDANGTAIYSGTLNDNQLIDMTRIFRVSPDKDTPAHYGGKLAWLEDDTLLLTTGDGFEYREAPQDPTSQLGKILRMTDEGKPAADNPMAEQGFPYLYSLGHRNPQGLAVDPNTGTIWMHEHGPRGGDELNRVSPGANYGWPATSFGINYSGAKISPLTSYEGIEDPALYFTPSIGPSHLLIYQGEQFPQWQGQLFISTLVDQDVKRIAADAFGATLEESLFSEFDARIRAIVEDDQGALYLLTDSDDGSIIKIEWSNSPVS